MNMTEKYILVSLDDERAKKISEVIGNKTCKKIIDYLSEHEATEIEISNKLNIPINTIDYNIKNLVSSGLIESKSHFWSVKGKKMPTYNISNKKILISPRSFAKRILVLPLIILGGLASLGMKLLTTNNMKINNVESYAQPMLTKAADSASTLASSSGNIPYSSFASSNAFWFISGCIVIFALYLVYNKLKGGSKWKIQ